MRKKLLKALIYARIKTKSGEIYGNGTFNIISYPHRAYPLTEQ